jgi:hypothetical protein
MMLEFWKNHTQYQELARDDEDAELPYSSIKPEKGFESRRRRRFGFVVVVVAIIGLIVWVFKGRTPLGENPVQTESSCDIPKPRREWRTLKKSEKQEYIDAVKCIYQVPSKLHNVSRLPDDFSWVHIRTSFDSKIENTEATSQAHR